MKKALSALLSLYIFLFGILSSTLAQTATSNSVVTQVGQPTSPKPIIGGSLAESAQDLVNAYTSCNSGSTIPQSNVSQCLQSTLLKDKYPQANVNQVAQISSFTSSSGCVECIGFVRQAIILTFGGEDPRLPSANGDTPYTWSTMNNNNHTFTNIGSGTPQPGDIAVTNSSPGEFINPGSNGHIDIVKSVRSTGSDVFFTGLDANWDYIDGYQYTPPSCVVSDDVEHPAQYYVFFRQQS